MFGEEICGGMASFSFCGGSFMKNSKLSSEEGLSGINADFFKFFVWG